MLSYQDNMLQENTSQKHYSVIKQDYTLNGVPAQYQVLGDTYVQGSCLHVQRYTLVFRVPVWVTCAHTAAVKVSYCSNNEIHVLRVLQQTLNVC